MTLHPVARPFTAALLGLAAAQALAADGPTFNCAKAQGAVEKQICADPALAALDRQLDAVYKAASAKAKGQSAAQLKAEQRGWVKGRNDCWKADGQETWITATWTVKTVKDCVDAQYRLRTSALQAVWRLLPPKTTLYACQANPANEVAINQFASSPTTIRLERGDRTATLWQVGPVADGKFEGQNIDLVLQSGGLKLNWLDTNSGKTDALDCKPK